MKSFKFFKEVDGICCVCSKGVDTGKGKVIYVIDPHDDFKETGDYDIVPICSECLVRALTE